MFIKRASVEGASLVCKVENKHGPILRCLDRDVGPSQVTNSPNYDAGCPILTQESFQSDRKGEVCFVIDVHRFTPGKLNPADLRQ